MAEGDDETPPGLSEEDFDRLAQVKALDDAALLKAYRALSNPHAVAASPWLTFLEAEIRLRGLMPPN